MSSTRAAATLALACMLAGCAALRPAAEPPSAASATAPSPVRVTIAAPDEARRLLENYLDIARISVVAPGEVISEAELQRLEAATPAQARALLATLGFMDPQVRVQRETGSGGGVPLVRVEVTTGARSRVEQVDLELQGPLADASTSDTNARATLAAWRSAWRMPVGAAFTDSDWREAKTAALAQLRAAGYANPGWKDTRAEVDAEHASVRLALTADSGPLYRTGAVVVEGLERQDLASVLNLAGFAPGTPATEALLLDYQERLQRAGLFERVTVALATDPATADAATVTVRVGELPLQQATTGIGISANNGPRISLEHLHRHAFGQRATLRNKLEVGRLRQAWDGELSSHTLPGQYRNLVGGTAERLDSDTDRVTSLRLRLGRAYDGQRIERLVFIEGERALVEQVAGSTADASPDTIAATLNFQGTWRDVDSVVLPTRGQSLALQTGIGRVTSSAGGATSGGFARLYGRAQFWRPLGGNWYGHARIELGRDFAPATVAVPETQRFRAGGDESVRGYAYRSLTPSVNGIAVGGRVLATASLEVAHPVSDALPSLWWAAFIDAGRAAARWSDWSAAKGAGLGIRWRSPVGPLRADLAYGEEVRQWRLHLSVGIAF